MDPITLPESWSGLFHAGYRCASHALAPTWVSLWEEWRADYGILLPPMLHRQ